MKNKIILDKKTGIVKNVIFDHADLVQSGVLFKLDISTDKNRMELNIKCELNDKFEISFE